MKQKTLNWQEIATAAKKVGAQKWAIYKWKHRRAVPPKWQIQIARELGCDPLDVKFDGQEQS